MFSQKGKKYLTELSRQLADKKMHNCSIVLTMSLSVLAVLTCCVLLESPASAKTEKARKASIFVDSIGINTHIAFTNSIYYKQFNSLVKPKLLELGVSRIRDTIMLYNPLLDRYKELGSKGISSTLISQPGWSSPEDTVKALKYIGKYASAIEGPNEYDGFSGDANWDKTLRNYMQQLNQSVKADPSTKRIPIISPSLASFLRPEYEKLGDLSAYVDFGNIHNYHSAYQPGHPGWWKPNMIDGITDYHMDNAKFISGSKPIISTEVGYTNAINIGDNTAVPEEAAEKYIPRTYLIQFIMGIQQTFCYELIDTVANPGKDDKVKHFGLLRNDGSEKPAYTAVKNLIQLLKDSKSNFTAGSLTYNLVGNTTDIRSLLLQKSNGNFYYIVWQEVSSYDVNSKKIINVPNRSLKLTLSNSFPAITEFSLNPSLTVSNQYSNLKEINLSVSDSPLIVELASSSLKSFSRSGKFKVKKSSPLMKKNKNCKPSRFKLPSNCEK